MNTHLDITAKNTDISSKVNVVKENEKPPIASLSVIQRLLSHMGKALSLEYVVNYK